MTLLGLQEGAGKVETISAHVMASNQKKVSRVESECNSRRKICHCNLFQLSWPQYSC